MNPTRIRWRARRPNAGIIALGLGIAVGLLAWVGFRAASERQRSSVQLTAQRLNTAADVLATALSRDMRGAESSVLQSIQLGSAILQPSYELGRLFASAFARYPYPESFLVWRGVPNPSTLVFFDRVDRPPPWTSPPVESAAFPVLTTLDAPVAEQLAGRFRADVDTGAERSVFEARLGGVPYQVVGRIFYDDSFREHVVGGVGFTVNLSWVRRFYFPELTTEIARVAGIDGFESSILDDAGVSLANDRPPLQAAVPSRRRTFQVLFADPLLLGLNWPPDLPDRQWVVQVQASSPSTQIGPLSRSTLLTLVPAALAAATLTLALTIMARAARASADIAEIRSDFVSSLTHELKTPLATLRAIGEAIASGRVTRSDAVQEYAQIVIQESKRLTRLVDNSLAYTRVTDIADVYHFEPAEAHAILEEALRGFNPQLTSQGFVVELDLSDDLTPIRGDRLALGLLFDNLLDNAIRYSGDSRWLSVAAREIDRAVLVTIADKGIGIAPDELAYVKRKFYRGKAAASGGTGLGLAIADRIVKAHGGRMVIQSAANRGTTVSVALPIAHEGHGKMRSDR